MFFRAGVGFWGLVRWGPRGVLRLDGMLYRILVALLLPALASCACVMPKAPNARDGLRARFDSVVKWYKLGGHDYRGVPWEALHVQVVDQEQPFRCGPAKKAVGCSKPFSWPTCERILILKRELQGSTPEHEFLHFILRAHGLDGTGHDKTWPDFYIVVGAAYWEHCSTPGAQCPDR